LLQVKHREEVDFDEEVVKYYEFLQKTLNKYTKKLEDSDCCQWTGKKSKSNGFDTPLVVFGSFNKFGKSAASVAWRLRYGSDLEDGFIVTNTCSHPWVCLNPDHLVAVSRKDFKIFYLMRDSGLVDKGLFVPGGSGYISPFLRNWYKSYKERGLLAAKKYKTQEK
jgi:hypothetical protein